MSAKSLGPWILVCAFAGASAFAESQLLFENSDFEHGSLENWTAEGEAMSVQPTKGDQLAARNGGTHNVQGQFWIGTAEKYDGRSGSPGAQRGHAPMGRLVSTPFSVTKPYITFRLGGGGDNQRLGVGLTVDGEELTGAFNVAPHAQDRMIPVSLDVTRFQGRQVRIVIRDEGDRWFQYVNVDDFRGADEPQGVVFRLIPKTELKDEWSTFPLYARVGYDQALRPQFHFTSRVGWLNDPNGMVFADGEWHMLFQHYAKGNASGAKSWGHAVSTDLIHWTQLPHAINPYPNVIPGSGGGHHAIWSGSAVVDFKNVLGKQKGDVKTLFAMYTATNQNAEKRAEFFQGAAYSTDRGRTWTKINGGKPVIAHQPDGAGGQRDPRLFYYAPGEFYVTIMMVGGKDRAVRLWKSKDLLNWEAFLDIPNKAAECIDMYTLPVDGDTSNMKWVIASAPTHYEVGDFDGRQWTGFGMRDDHGRVQKFDFGDCYYAAQAFNHGPDGRVVHVGWLRCGSQFIDAGMPFTQQMSVPAEITLRSSPQGIRMFRNPVREIETLYEHTTRLENLSAPSANRKLAAVTPELVDLTLAFVAAGDFCLTVRGQDIFYEQANEAIVFTNTDRVETERTAMSKRPPDQRRPVPDTARKVIPAPAVNGTVKLRVLVDRASLELFVNDGQAAASFVVFPDAADRRIRFSGNDGLLLASLVVNELKSAWITE